MRRSRISLLLIVLLAALVRPVKGQDFKWLAKGEFSNFYLAPSNQVYLVKPNQALLKHNLKGGKQYSINVKMLGRLGSVDVLNPLEILLYYPEPNVAVFTDNTLTEKKRWNLDNLGFSQAKLATRSSETGIWIYDESDVDLKRIDQEGKIIYESDQLYRYVKKDINPIALKAQSKQVYLNVPAKGILLFDNFGSYIKTVPIKGIRTFQVANDVLFYWKKGKVGKFNLNTFARKKADFSFDQLPEKVKKLRFWKGSFYVLDQSGLKLYKD